MPKKSWDSSEINRESQDKKIVLVMIAVIVAVILMSLLMWSIKSSML